MLRVAYQSQVKIFLTQKKIRLDGIVTIYMYFVMISGSQTFRPMIKTLDNFTASGNPATHQKLFATHLFALTPQFLQILYLVLCKTQYNEICHIQDINMAKHFEIYPILLATLFALAHQALHDSQVGGLLGENFKNCT